jgi:hypothetical protein
MSTLITKENINEIEAGMKLYHGIMGKYFIVKQNLHLGDLIIDRNGFDVHKSEDDIIKDECWYFEPPLTI